MSKLAISNIHKTILNNRSKDKKNENLIRTLNIRENIPFTNRESKNLNNDYMSILNSKIRKIKSFNKRISNSISSKKNFIQNISSNNLNRKQKEFQTLNNENNSIKKINYRNKNFNFNLNENLSIPLNSNYLISKSNFNMNSSSKSPNHSPEKKIIKNYEHFHSKSSLIGNNEKKKMKKIRNSVFPKKEINFKGFQIKGFKELLQNSNNFNSRNSKGSSSERILFNENGVCKTNRNSNFSSKTFMEMYATIHKK